MIDGKIVENVDLNLSSDNVRNCEEEIPLVKEYETTILWSIRRKESSVWRIGLLFKNFKESDKFKKMLQGIQVSKSTIYIKVKLVEVLEK